MLAPSLKRREVFGESLEVCLAGSIKNKQIISPIPLAVSSQRVNIWYHSDPHDQWKRVTWPKTNTGLGLSLGAKLVSTNDRASILQ